ncbi:MAG: hypothetical protein IJ551_06445 [Prevotella sp.]|nr:hypothetical protein [Prevotella sp.]
MKYSKSFKSIIVAVAAPMLLSSCATIISGGDPSITINGNVNEPVNITTTKQTYQGVKLPAVVKVNRHKLDGQRILITSESYKFNDIILEKKVNGWAFGNILIGGLIGWGVDLGTNAVVEPVQTHFTVQPLPKQGNKEATKE